jgi:hypothetical protein
VVNQSKRHTRPVFAPVSTPLFGREAEVIEKAVKCGLIWVWLGQTLILKIKNGLFVWFSPILIHLQPYN